MSWNVSVFISANCSLEAVADDVGAFLDTKMNRVADPDEGVRFQCVTPESEILLYADHGMANDRDMDFESYKYQLAFWRLNSDDREQAQKNTLDLGWKIFDALRASEKYRLMLVENAENKLASFAPRWEKGTA